MQQPPLPQQTTKFPSISKSNNNTSPSPHNVSKSHHSPQPSLITIPKESSPTIPQHKSRYIPHYSKERLSLQAMAPYKTTTLAMDTSFMIKPPTSKYTANINVLNTITYLHYILNSAES
jgi:hypothetical protein